MFTVTEAMCFLCQDNVSSSGGEGTVVSAFLEWSSVSVQNRLKPLSSRMSYIPRHIDMPGYAIALDKARRVGGRLAFR